MARRCAQPKRPRNAAWFKEKLMLAEAQEAGQILDEEQLAFLVDPAVLMANPSSCDLEVLSEVPYSDSYPNDMINQDVQEMHYSKQTHANDYEDNEIHSSSNIISYSQYLQESQDAVIQDTNPSTPNDLLVLSLVEQMIHHVAHLDKENQTNKMVNESLTAELEKYKERIAIFKQILNEINTLNETLSNIVKEKELLSKTLTVFKTESKEKESNVIAKEHTVIYVLDDEETLILEEESRSKMLDKQNDPISIEKKIKISPIDHSKLNKIKEDFRKRFVTQKELSAEQPFWLKYLSLSKTPVTSHTPIRIKASSKHPKCSVDKNVFEIQIKQLRIGNDQFLYQIMSQEIVHIVTNSVDILDEKKLKNNRDAHEVYIEKTREYADTLCGFVEHARTQYPSEPLLEYACMFTKHVQELLVYASQTCLNSPKPSEKLVAVTPINKNKRVRFAKPVTSSNNIPKQTDSLKTKDSNKPLLTSTDVKPTTSASGSKPSGNTKNNKITRPPRINQKNKVEDHPRKVKSSLNKTNSISEPISNALVKHAVRNTRFESICAICKKCLFDANHDMCLVDFVNDVNVRSKSKSKINKKSKSWKPTDKAFPDVGFKWKPTCRFFTIIGNSCPLTRITPKKIVHLKETTPKLAETLKPDIKFYSRRPKQIKSVGCPDHPLVSGLRMFKTYKREPLSAHELCVDILLGSRDTNLYTISLDDMLKTSPICLLSKALKTKSWLWHRRLSHLNFACALGKSKKSSHQPKAKDANQKKLYLLHMDLYGPMRVESINEKKYILVIVDDYSRFTWVKFLRSKDEAPDAIIKCIKNIQVRLNATVRNVRIDNGTKFLNQNLRDFYENVSISHQTSVARTPQQNDVVERQNRTLVEAAHTMLIFSKAPMFLWAEAINKACYTQNRSLIRRRYNKTPYELMHDKKSDLSFFHVFGSLCYPTNDSEDLGKLNAKADIVPVAAAPRAVEIADSPVSMYIDQEAPSSNSTSQGPSFNMRPSHTPFELIGRWTKDHPRENVIGDPSCSVSTIKQL
uniref:Retrovirus-related Pol polyprotein from transposon TNT 1-94 n=1 Tax=Tanacetum cinerariifolium TaxID=118510 RepID=A0A699I1Y7_TANCI|nr:retrovirus-related Pol polyprotein from transposon TNT 1-94 [Tanacetum cinerariifolium]